jgi:hypothetical protein
MKGWIKKLLRENLDELSTKQKGLFNKGAFHKLYTSHNNPDRLYKLGENRDVNEWVPIFKKYPEYFPKVYRVFPYKKNTSLTVVEVEKLDTDKASNDIDKIEEFLLDISDKVSCGGRFINMANFFELPCFNKVMEAAKNDKELRSLIATWAIFFADVAPIVEDIMDRPLDNHSGNVAYDSQGNPKMIDI